APAAAATTAPAAAATTAPAAAAATSAPAATKPAAAPAASAPAAAATGAKPTGTLTIYSALNESTNKEFVDAFTKVQPGLKCEVLPLAAAGELQTRIRTEKASPKCDVFIGGSSEFHDPLGKEGLLEAYKAPGAEAVDKE